MSAEQLYHISYSGIEPVSAARANELSVNERAMQSEMISIHEAQRNRLGDKAENVISATVTAGMIVRCPSAEVHDYYDAVFGTGSQPKSARIIEFPRQQSPLQAIFGESAAKFRAGIDFPKAAAPVAGIANAPALERTLEAA